MPPSPHTNWTRLVLHPVLSGHVSSFPPMTNAFPRMQMFEKALEHAGVQPNVTSPGGAASAIASSPPTQQAPPAPTGTGEGEIDVAAFMGISTGADGAAPAAAALPAAIKGGVPRIVMLTRAPLPGMQVRCARAPEPQRRRAACSLAHADANLA